MDCELNRRRFHEALAKAFAARSANVRSAYFDLASFYHERLGGGCDPFATNEDLRNCLKARNRVR